LSAAPSAGTIVGMRILLAEDEKRISGFVSKALQEQGF